MNTEKLYRLKEMLCREVDNMVEKGEMSAGDLEVAHKLTDTIKNVDKIIMLEDAGGYSGDDMNGRSYGRSYGNSYNYSGYRGQSRDSMGRYSGNDNYSGAKYVHGYYRDGIKDKLEELMNEAGTEKERRAIQKAMDCIE